MKKTIIIALILSLALVLVACNSEKTQSEMVKEKVSYEEKQLLKGKNDEFQIEVLDVSGEIAPLLDGIVGECKSRHIVKVKPINNETIVESPKLTLSNKDNTLDITLTKDVLGMSYTSCLDDGVLTFEPTNAKMSVGDKECQLKLESVLKDCKINSTQAVDTAFNSAKEDLATYFEKNKMQGEVVVKLISSEKVTSSPYYFYVSFVKNKDEYVACLVDPMSGEVLHKKIK